ncbi:hypothetical protein BJ085DRAFT_35941 [Dimargaris cristalligena]|uniref:Uncharacterized protein n=1 Tax=Dimargaris cristalligena TaxID=215637 RepID=A0A4P9ZLQ8_9FUNG|nr:hypothetical protein BJ085DRAFT_35941 [Dimargaris cristalligena]|eukprot:RKP33150.1 hypothetical protein BJ085DRAFT_35941 [Dimargaris cristalligena]
MWNLGWMHENGLGVPRDFHMALRCYERAALTYPRGSFPVTLSIIQLAVKYYWAWIRGEDVGTRSLFFGSDGAEDQAGEGGYTGLPPNHDIEDDREVAQGGQAQQPPAQGVPDRTPGGGEASTTLVNPVGFPPVDDQPLGWRNPFGYIDPQRGYYPNDQVIEEMEAHRRQQRQEYIHRAGLDDPMGGFERDNDEAEFRTGRLGQDHELELNEDTWLENLVIFGLCALVGWMMYVRQNRFGHNNNNNNNMAADMNNRRFNRPNANANAKPAANGNANSETPRTARPGPMNPGQTGDQQANVFRQRRQFTTTFIDDDDEEILLGNGGPSRTVTTALTSLDSDGSLSIITTPSLSPESSDLEVDHEENDDNLPLASLILPGTEGELVGEAPTDSSNELNQVVPDLQLVPKPVGDEEGEDADAVPTSTGQPAESNSLSVTESEALPLPEASLEPAQAVVESPAPSEPSSKQDSPKDLE